MRAKLQHAPQFSTASGQAQLVLCRLVASGTMGSTKTHGTEIQIHGKFPPVERLSFSAKHSRSMALGMRTSQEPKKMYLVARALDFVEQISF